MTETNATALDRDQVEEQIRTWFAKGLPEGQIFFREDKTRVHIKMPEPGSVVVWAQAMCLDVAFCFGVYSTRACEPIDLGGWQFEVWCDAPVVTAAQRIAVRGAAS